MSMAEVKYFVVDLPRTKATVAVDLSKKMVKVIECSNSDFCTKFKIAVGGCPPYCQVVVEAKNYAFKRGRVRAAIYEVSCGGFGY